MEQPNGQQTMSTGRATYPPAYNAPGAQFDRGARRYIKARIDGDTAVAELARNSVESAIQRVERGQ